MTILGIDFGNDGSRIATLLKVKRLHTNTIGNQLTVVLNQSSERTTPSIITHKGKERFLGDAAVNVRVSNAKNTMSEFKMLIGKKIDDPEVISSMPYFSAKLVPGPNDEVAYSIDTGKFAATIPVSTAMSSFFGKMKEIVTFAADGSLDPFRKMEGVVSVPEFFNQHQRQLVIEACKISGITPLAVISDPAALAMEYGFTKLDLPANDDQTKPLYVCFVLCGHAYTTVSIAAMKKDNFTILSSASTSIFGGRVVDRRIASYFARLIEKKCGEPAGSVMQNPRNVVRLLAAAERTKKVLSGGPVAQFSVENILDNDYQFTFTRQELEDLLTRGYTETNKDIVVGDNCVDVIKSVCEEALKNSGLALADIDVIEAVGGTSRVPMVKDIAETFFAKPLSFTLNSEEAIAKGCALTAVRLSSAHRIREVSLHDALNSDVLIEWFKEDSPQTLKLLKAFKKHTKFEVTSKSDDAGVNVVFKRTKPFSFKLKCTDGPTTSSGLSAEEGQTTLSVLDVLDVPAMPADAAKAADVKIQERLAKGENVERAVKVRVALSRSGLVRLDHAFIEEDFIVEEKNPKKKEETPADPLQKEFEGTEGGNHDTAQEDSMRTDSDEEEDSSEDELPPVQPDMSNDVVEYETVEVKKQRKVILRSRSVLVGEKSKEALETETKNHLRSFLQDTEFREMINVKNALEMAIYALRESFDEGGKLRPYASEEGVKRTLTLADEIGDWLNRDGKEEEDDEKGYKAVKAEYDERLKELTKESDKAQMRMKQESERAALFSEIEEVCADITVRVNSSESSHIDNSKKQTILQEVEDWQRETVKMKDQLAKMQKYEDSPFVCTDVARNFEQIRSSWVQVLSAPKPPPKPVSSDDVKTSDVPSPPPSSSNAHSPVNHLQMDDNGFNDD
ncbi:putative Heat shock protein [Blattamonas nauphoetae]|uniref:Heat shock protein n=1 Tax=Blattamonas nauphoetae TaxID=2049346 RepID=A0ABQ9X613_9EUKA|nr:putative Heat shock protein [Blattamonas nauphoetae]